MNTGIEDSLLLDADVLFFLDTCALNNIGELYAIDKAIGQMVADGSSSMLRSIESDNQSLTPANAASAVQQRANRAYINTVLSGVDTLTAAQASDLWDIAVRCPSDRGPGVYTARAVLAVMLDTIVDYPDTCAVDTSGLRQAYETASTKPLFSSLTVYPNPADNVVNIGFLNPIDVSAVTVMTVSDALGKEVHRFELTASSGTVRINTSVLPSGVYVLTWKDNSGKAHRGKFVVAH